MREKSSRSVDRRTLFLHNQCYMNRFQTFFFLLLITFLGTQCQTARTNQSFFEETTDWQEISEDVLYRKYPVTVDEKVTELIVYKFYSPIRADLCSVLLIFHNQHIFYPSRVPPSIQKLPNKSISYKIMIAHKTYQTGDG